MAPMSPWAALQERVEILSLSARDLNRTLSQGKTMTAEIHKFEGQCVGKVVYGLDMADVEDKKVPGFSVVVEAKVDQFPDVGAFINELDGNIKRCTLSNKLGTEKIAFDAACGKASIDRRVEFAGEPEIRFIKIPFTVSRRFVDTEDGGIVRLLDIFGEGFVLVTLAPKQLKLGLAQLKKQNKDAEDKDFKLESAKKAAKDAAKKETKPVGRKPRGFSRSHG